VTTLLAEAKALRIRAAAQQDIPRLVEMGCRLLSDSYPAHLTPNADALDALALRLMTGGEDTTLLVAETDGQAVGMLGLMAYAHPMSGERIAAEACWYVDPEARGTAGLRLLRAGEQWARERGATALQMIQPFAADRIGDLYARLGYAPVEVTWQKSLEART